MYRNKILGLVLTFIFMLLFFACKPSNSANESVSFSKVVNVKASLDSVKTEPVLLLVRNLVSTNENVVALGADNNLLFNVFDSHTGEYKGGFGKEGEGPDDFRNAFPSGLNFFNNQLSIGDLNAIRKFNDFDNQFPNNRDIKASENVKYLSTYIPLNYPFFLNDSIVCGQADFSDKQLSCFYISTRRTFGLIDYPFLRDDVPANANYHLYKNQVGISPDQKKIVIVYSFFPLIKIYDTVNKVVNDIYFKSSVDQKEKVEVGPNNRTVNILDLYTYYSNIAISENFIYAFYHEKEFLDPGNSPQIISKSLSEKEIHIFSMQGEPVVKIILEDWMRLFTVTQDDAFLYFVHPEKEDYLFRFSLRDVIS